MSHFLKKRKLRLGEVKQHAQGQTFGREHGRESIQVCQTPKTPVLSNTPRSLISKQVIPCELVPISNMAIKYLSWHNKELLSAVHSVYSFP